MADTQDLSTLTQMVQLGGCYIDCQDEADDKAQIDTMTTILETITTELMPVEIKEAPEPPMYDSMGGVSAMEAG